MAIPILPETAPFSPAQRAWLNGFFAGVFGVDRGTNLAAPNGNGHLPPNGKLSTPAPVVEEDFPWHDAALPMDERLKLAEGKPIERVMMAAMAQLDCGACGYLCKTYSEAIASGEETELTKCTPGGKETAKKLKELAANRKALPTVGTNGRHTSNGTAAPERMGTRRKQPRLVRPRFTIERTRFMRRCCNAVLSIDLAPRKMCASWRSA